MANSQTGTISYSIVGCRMIMIEVAAASHYINWISITLTFVILVVVVTSIANTSPIISRCCDCSNTITAPPTLEMVKCSSVDPRRLLGRIERPEGRALASGLDPRLPPALHLLDALVIARAGLAANQGYCRNAARIAGRRVQLAGFLEFLLERRPGVVGRGFFFLFEGPDRTNGAIDHYLRPPFFRLFAEVDAGVLRAAIGDGPSTGIVLVTRAREFVLEDERLRRNVGQINERFAVADPLGLDPSLAFLLLWICHCRRHG